MPKGKGYPKSTKRPVKKPPKKSKKTKADRK